jgi:hypothetical protein
MQQLAPKTKFEQVTICGSKKAIDLGDTIAGQSPWKAIKAKLQGRLSKGEPPTSLGSFECPGDAASPPLAGPKPGPVITPDIIHAPGPGPVEMKAQ